ncbi:MAG: hypothetical protein MUO73_03435 [Thermoplasmata archaeon]|nr:hypothetical protein [Thermoplasmata archaeon]
MADEMKIQSEEKMTRYNRHENSGNIMVILGAIIILLLVVMTTSILDLPAMTQTQLSIISLCFLFGGIVTVVGMVWSTHASNQINKSLTNEINAELEDISKSINAREKK